MGEISMPILITSVDISRSKEFVFSSIKKEEYIQDIEIPY